MKYGLLTSTGLNLGDIMQSVAIRPFLPQVDLYLDGCYLNKVQSSEKIRLIIHGHFEVKGKNWPPAPCIEPLITSLSIGEGVRKEFLSEKSIQYFKKYEPIGCRDHPTLHLLQERGVEAYFSGCVTLMLKRRGDVKRTNEIILTDLDSKIKRYLPKWILTNSTTLCHGSGIPWEMVADKLYGYSPRLYETVKATRIHLFLGSLQQGLVRLFENNEKIEYKFQKAEDLLVRYARAKLVITSRLHAALPCLAFDTPVIYIYRGSKDPRFPGLLDYLRAYSMEEFKYKIKEIDLENPKPNPRSIDGLRDSLTRTCKQFIEKEE